MKNNSTKTKTKAVAENRKSGFNHHQHVGRTTVRFTKNPLDEAIKEAGFAICHPYIRWPTFGHKDRKELLAEVELVQLRMDETPNQFIESCREEGYWPLSAADLAEFVRESDVRLDEDVSLFAFGEHCNIAGYDGYPYARLSEGERQLKIWYFYKEWPQKAVAAVRKNGDDSLIEAKKD